MVSWLWNYHLYVVTKTVITRQLPAYLRLKAQNFYSNTCSTNLAKNWIIFNLLCVTVEKKINRVRGFDFDIASTGLFQRVGTKTRGWSYLDRNRRHRRFNVSFHAKCAVAKVFVFIPLPEPRRGMFIDEGGGGVKKFAPTEPERHVCVWRKS